MALVLPFSGSDDSLYEKTHSLDVVHLEVDKLANRQRVCRNQNLFCRKCGWAFAGVALDSKPASHNFGDPLDQVTHTLDSMNCLAKLSLRNSEFGDPNFWFVESLIRYHSVKS